MTEEYLTYGHRLEQHIADTAAAVLGRCSTTAAPCSSRARRARCSTSTTAPIRSSRRRTRSRAPPASAPASGRSDIDEVWGVAKAYATRVGAGPFPTELDDELGEELRERGGEFGTTTGRAAAHRLARPRRAALRRAHQRADRARRSPSSTCSRGLETIRVCTRYRGERGARRSTHFPYHQSVLHHAVGEYDRAARLERGHRRVPRAVRAARRTRATTSTSSRSYIGVPVVARRRRPGPRAGRLDAGGATTCRSGAVAA